MSMTKIPVLLQRPGPIPKADKDALNARMVELGGKAPAKRKAPGKPAKKPGKGGRRGY